MKDRITGLAIHVSTDGTAGPYIRVGEQQLKDVTGVLEKHQIRYWLQENVISMSGGPFMAVVNLGRGADAGAVQAILDSLQ